jgi:hypothetical protein
MSGVPCRATGPVPSNSPSTSSAASLKLCDAAGAALKKGDFAKFFDKEDEVRAEQFALGQQALKREDEDRAERRREDRPREG